jgi:hemerythrin HHE cation binding domain-containing protein
VAASIADYLTGDHRRLEGLLDTATGADPVEPGPYAEFRRGLLRHIAIEEKVLLPAAEEARNGVPLEVAARLRLDHGAIAALLVPTPTPVIVATLRRILDGHNLVEEGPDGLYAVCERLLEAKAASIVGAMARYPSVKANPHNDGPGVMAAVERALARAGHRLAP